MYKQVPVFQAEPYILRSSQIMSILPRTFKVPVEWNGTQHESNERKGSVNLVRRGCHAALECGMIDKISKSKRSLEFYNWPEGMIEPR